MAAAEAEKLLDIRPAIFTDIEEMNSKVPDLTAVGVMTNPSVHHDVACQALDLGLHVIVEKPMAITVRKAHRRLRLSVRACQKMLDAAQRNNCKLSVAENYRRDASARLVNHLLKTGAIGKPYRKPASGVGEASEP